MPEKKSAPKSQQMFGSIVYWVSILSTVGALIVPIFILARPENNMLNPNLVFEAIFRGASPDEIWGYTEAGTFPGAHFYIEHITKADSWAMLFISIGCAFALFGLVPAAIYQAVKEKDWFCSIFGAVIIGLIFFSMIGVISI